MRTLFKAGYPFKATDLNISTWLLLGEVEELVEKVNMSKESSAVTEIMKRLRG